MLQLMNFSKNILKAVSGTTDYLKREAAEGHSLIV
jgi:hypothetical protein